MTGEELRELVELDPERFDAREHAALCWVRETLTRREGASRDTLERFERAFDERQRRHIVATMKAMYFFNLAGNTLDGWLRRMLGQREDAHEACVLSRD
ncbi:MAG: hypothetical protein C4536_03375 [Actinobacteria bacterium]|jgi:hypothetical protein|nr:MAG: hypothetical protein C4536_03375 [Actinomycetota bacterium]